MDYDIYRISLGIALTLMLFFAFYFFVGKTPDKPVFENYKRSRRIMGVALLVLATNYAVHLFVGLRFKDPEAAIVMNLSTYFLSYWLFSAALIMLLNRFYVTTARFIRNIVYWLMLTALACIVLFAFPTGAVCHIGILVLAAWLLAYGIYLSRRIIKTYHRAVELFDDTHSENIAAYIRWMSIFTWWAVIYGVSCGLLTFLPDEFVFIWILSSIPFYIYLYCSYMNYLLFYEQVETILESSAKEELQPEEDSSKGSDQKETTNQPDIAASVSDNIEKKLAEWVALGGFTSPGITIEEIANKLGTNRTYLSTYIKQNYGMSFREWIANLRIEYAKQLLNDNPRQSTKDICDATGFISQSYFIKVFTDKEGVSPGKWRKKNCSINKKLL